jgi:hypothetical protein
LATFDRVTNKMPPQKDRGWTDDPQVPIDPVQVTAAIQRDGRSGRAIAAAVDSLLGGRARDKYVAFSSQRLSHMCKGAPPRRCRASARRALAQVLDVPEVYLVRRLPMPGPGNPQVFIEWSELVLSLGLWRHSPQAHAALLDLPDSLGLAMLHLWGRGTALTESLPLRPAQDWFVRAGVRHQSAWNEWLRQWIAAEGKETVAATLRKHTKLVAARLVGADRYWKPKLARHSARAGVRKS